MSEEQDLTAWVGRTEEKTAVVQPGLDRVVRGVLGLPESSSLTHGLHWMLFDEFVPLDQVGADGHPKRGGFLPPVPLPRRMWAGSRINFLAPLNEGDTVTRQSTIRSVNPKEGKAGPLVFVTVQHKVMRGDTTLIDEEQDIVYMNIGQAAPQMDTVPAPDGAVEITPDEVMLFRYSALTKNSHRIHYDAKYAQEVEKYPALVVHGPLTATLLMAHTVAANGDRPLTSFAFRGQSPLYVGNPLRLQVRETGEEIEAIARNNGDAVAMSAIARVSES